MLHSPFDVLELGLVHKPVERGAAAVALFFKPPKPSIPFASTLSSSVPDGDAVDASEVDRKRCPFAPGEDAREERSDDDVEPVRRCSTEAITLTS